MIKHMIEKKTEPVQHQVKYHIARRELQRIRLLFELDYEEWGEKKLETLDINKGSFESILGVTFDDGAKLEIDLCCGECNYYDDVLFTHPNGKEETLDCCYDLDDIEIDTDTDVYYVKLVIDNE